jgi:hypothetical protein
VIWPVRPNKLDFMYLIADIERRLGKMRSCSFDAMLPIMRITISLDEDTLLVARRLAASEHLSLGQAVSRLIRRGAAGPADALPAEQMLRGRYALLPVRDDVVTPEQIRELMRREGI